RRGALQARLSEQAYSAACFAAGQVSARRARSEGDERAHLGRLARRGIGPARRIVESGVRGEPGPARVGVEALEEHRLVRVHAGVVEPAVAGIEAERVDLARAIPVAEVTRDEVAHRDGARIADGEWRLFHAAA